MGALGTSVLVARNAAETDGVFISDGKTCLSEKNTERTLWYSQTLEAAMAAVRSGQSLKRVSRKFCIDRHVLRRHRDKEKVPQTGKVKLGSFLPTLLAEFEDELTSHALDMQQRGLLLIFGAIHLRREGKEEAFCCIYCGELYEELPTED